MCLPRRETSVMIEAFSTTVFLFSSGVRSLCLATELSYIVRKQSEVVGMYVD